ncbi:DUF1365 domain-containing protein [Vibrio salinus]|uniref:DUF1365 domain-containing protein n=1 Tax=Vibrio salinus TaxID=2899784 RepID=UPI001E5475DA|nr:DUF1365 family protein [Vibrio salinus]MCE0496240.1 DUF1365 domain-containing protein [Vibrio salinus]
MDTDFTSRLLTGIIRHRRYVPTQHELTYPVFMVCINLDEIARLSSQVTLFGTHWWHWARFKHTDYFRDRGPDTKSAVIDTVNKLTEQSLKKDDCKVMAVIHLRYLDFYFSPVNFYYVYDAQEHWNSLVAEVSNTPWNERHYYVLRAGCEEMTCEKAFHVSPFNPVDQCYQWRLKPLGKSLSVHIECHRDVKEFDATLTMKSVPFTNQNLNRLLIRTPVQTLKMLLGIYWHAFVLWKKGTPVYDHPEKDAR